MIGALLTSPSDGKPDNFIYDPDSKSFISIDNDEIFAPAVLKTGDIYLKSILFTLPLMKETIPPEVYTWFLTPVPELAMLSWFAGIEKRNSLYAQLGDKLLFYLTKMARNQMGEYDAKENIKALFSDEHLDLPIKLPQFVCDDVFRKLKVISNFSRLGTTLTLYELFENLLDPMLASYYIALRQRSKDPYDAIGTLYSGKAPKVGLNIEEIERIGKLAEQPAQGIQELKGQLKSKEGWQLSSIDPVLEEHMAQWWKGTVKNSRLLEDLMLLKEENIFKIANAKLAANFWGKAEKNLPSQQWKALFSPFFLHNGGEGGVDNPEVKWFADIETHSSQGWPHRESHPQNISEIKGVALNRRLLSENIKKFIFDSERNFQKDSLGTEVEAKLFYPKEKPFFLFKKHPAFPGYEYAALDFMRRFGIKDTAYSDLLMFYHPKGAYPVLIKQVANGDSVYKVWDQEVNFASLDPYHTGLMILSAMLLNPGNGHENNFIITSNRKRLVPLSNEQVFLPGVIRDVKNWANGSKAYTTLQPTTLLFCLEEMQHPFSKSAIDKVTSLNVDEFLSSWVGKLINVHTSYQLFFDKKNDKNTAQKWQERGVNLGIIFTEQFVKNLYFKFHQLQFFLKENPQMLPIDLLLRLEPYVGKHYKEALQNELTLQDRFRYATSAMEKESSLQGDHFSIVDDIKMIKALKVAPRGIADPFSGNTDPNKALGEFEKLKKEKEDKGDAYSAILKEKFVQPFVGDVKNPNREKEHLSGVSKLSLPEVLAIHSSYSLDAAKLEDLLRNKGVGLKLLDLRGAQKADLRALATISMLCPNLEYLNISGWGELERVANVNILSSSKDLVVSKGPLFPALKRLVVNDCPKLKVIQGKLPHLEILEMRESKGVSLDLNTPVLRFLDLTGYWLEPQLVSLRVKNMDALTVKGIFPQNKEILDPDAVLNKSSSKIHLNKTANRKWNLRDWDLLPLFQQDLKHITFLNLSSNTLTNCGVDFLARAKMPMLTELNLSKNKISSRAARKLAKYSTWTDLQKLDLSFNSIGDEGAKGLVKSNVWTKLQKLDLSANSIGDSGVGALAQNTSWGKLQALNLRSNLISEGGAKELASNVIWTNLENLDLGSNLLGSNGIRYLALSASWPNLQTLDLRSNSMGSEGAKALASNKMWSKLEDLNIRFNSVGDEGLNALAQNTSWTGLQKLYLSSNSIRKEGVKRLAQNASWTGLKNLDLSSNQIGDEGAKELARNESWANLKMLNIANNEVSDVGYKILTNHKLWKNHHIETSAHDDSRQKSAIFDVDTKPTSQQEPFALYQLGNKFRKVQDELAVKYHWQKSFEAIATKPSSLDSSDHYVLAKLYENGYPRKDFEQALKYYERAAESNMLARSELGRCYKEGLGTKIDLNKALRYVKESSKKECAGGHYQLALMHLAKEGVDQKNDNDKKALDLFRKALVDLEDNADAYYMLKWMYESGRGGLKDPAEIQKRIQECDEGSKKGYVQDAFYSIGRMYEYGLTVEKNISTALEWYLKAVKANYERAKLKLQSFEADEEYWRLAKELKLKYLWTPTVQVSPRPTSRISQTGSLIKVSDNSSKSDNNNNTTTAPNLNKLPDDLSGKKELKEMASSPVTPRNDDVPINILFPQYDSSELATTDEEGVPPLELVASPSSDK